MDRRNWLEKGQSLIQKFKINDLSYKYKNLPHQIFYLAAAPFSGPIAILFDRNITHQFVLPKNYDSSIIIFNCKGEVKKEIPFELKDRVICFSFLPDEDLLLVEASGNFHIIDPYSGHSKSGSYYEPSKDRYVGCEVLNDRLVLMKQKNLGITSSFSGKWQQINSVKVHFQNPVFSKYGTLNEDESIIYLSKFYTIEEFSLKRQRKSTIFSDQYLQEQWPRLVAVSKNQNNKLALIFRKPWTILYIDLTTNSIQKIQPLINQRQQSIIYKYKSIHKYRKMFDIGWLGNFVVFSNRRFIFMCDGLYSHIELNPNKIVFQVDGFRSYSNENSLYRQVNQFYYSLTNLNSNINEAQKNNHNMNEFYSLYREYRNFQNRKLITINELSEKVQGIEDILEKIIENAHIIIDPMEQVTVMKFISFLKNYYTSKINISQLSSEFRIINNLKFEHMSRTLTIKQFQLLKYEQKQQFMTILLRYNMHFMADVIFGDSASKQRIFLHWAKCKIQKYSEQIAFEQIITKFKTLEKKIKGKKVFTDIARYCIDRGKMSLAYQFIELEEHSGRKIMVCLVILSAKKDKKIIQKLLNFAQESEESFLIYRVIKELIKAEWIQNYLWVNILHSRKNVERHYIQYLKANRHEELLTKYYLQNKMKEDLGLIGLRNQLKKQENKRILINKVGDELSKLLPIHSKLSKKYQQNESLTLLKQIRNGQKQVDQATIRYFEEDKQLLYLGQILLDLGNEQKAIQAFKAIKSNEAYTVLQRKGKFSQAIELASQRNNKEALLQIRQKCPRQLEPLVDETLLKISS